VTVDWPALEKLLDAGDASGVHIAVRDLDDKQRRALARPLQDYEKLWWSATSGRGHDSTAAAMKIAGAGCLPGASAVAAWLGRFGRHWGEGNRAVLEVLRARPTALREEVALRLGNLRGLSDSLLGDLAVALVADTGVEPPATNSFAIAWLWTFGFRWGHPLIGLLREDPLLPHAHRLLFEPDDVGRLLQNPRLPDWPAALATLVDEGRLDRAVIIDACLGRLLRGGTPTQLRTYLQIYHALQVSLDEATTRTRDLLPLLPDSVSTVAGLAQAELRRIDEAGRLATETLAQASQATLFRPEKKLAAAQLSWLEAVIKRSPDRAPELLPALTVAFGHPAPEVQQKAVALLSRHARHLSAQARAQAAEAADGLPDDLRRRLAGVLGEVPGEAAGAEAASAEAPPGFAPPPFTAASVPAPIGSPAELAEEVAAILEAAREAVIQGNAGGVDAVALERALAGLVALTHADRAGVAAALAPVRGRWKAEPGPPGRDSGKWPPWAVELFPLVVGAAAGLPGPIRTADWGEGSALPGRLTAPLAVLTHRMLEIAAGISAGPVPSLVATPTEATGHLDPAVLLARLGQAAAQRWQPWEYDLQQALLRLPRETDPQVAVAARRLGTPAGERLADWLEGGGLADLALQRVECERRHFTYDRRPGGGWETVTALHVAALQVAEVPPPAPRSLAGMLVSLPDPRHDPSAPIERREWTACWPAVAPSHRDLIAAYLLRPWPRAYEGTELPLLAEADGPAGPGISLSIAGGLGAEEEGARAATVDGLLILAGRGQLDGAAVGADLAALVSLGHRKLTRVVPRLRDAARAGARIQVWDAIAAALPPLLAAALDKPANGLADLVALGTELAPAASASPIPELAVYSAQKKGTRLATEARRLHAHLTRTASPAPTSTTIAEQR
jgi:Family of unknown function (DUF6493)